MKKRNTIIFVKNFKFDKKPVKTLQTIIIFRKNYCLIFLSLLLLGVINLGINRQHLLLVKTKLIKFGDFGLSAELQYLKEISFAKRKVKTICQSCIKLSLCVIIHLVKKFYLCSFPLDS